jgi:uncharacterized protein
MKEIFLKLKGDDIKRNLINLSQLVFEVTDGCNLSCKYCGYGELYDGYDPRSSGSLSLKKACNILDYLAKLWKENIGTSLVQPFTLSFYGGEPLINMKLIKEVIQYAESLNISSKKFRYNMTTNGLLLNKYMNYLVDKKFNLLISLDGNEKDHSYRVDHHGMNSHKRIVDNIRLLQQNHPEYFNEHVNFISVIHNINSVESAHFYIKDKFGKATMFFPLNNAGVRKDKVNEFNLMYQNVDNSIEKSGKRNELEAELFLGAPNVKQLTEFIRLFSGNMVDSFNSLFLNRSKSKVLPTGTCIPFSKKMFITVTGRILQCERIDFKFALGHVSDNLVEIDCEHIAEMANDYILRFIRQCKTCAYLRRCTQCVYQIDEINSSNAKCYRYASHKSFQDYVNANLDYLGKNPGLYKKIMKNVHISN